MAMVNDERTMTAKKPCRYGEYGLFERLFFLLSPGAEFCIQRQEWGSGVEFCLSFYRCFTLASESRPEDGSV